jgi:hypothetical protein
VRDFANHLERQLILAARAEEHLRPPPRLRRAIADRPRTWLIVPAVAVVVGVTVFAFAPAPTPPLPAPPLHAQVVAFRYPTHGADDGYIVATVTDPFAAQSSLDAAFRAAGLNIVVTLEPASPSLVGTVLGQGGPSSGPQIEPLYGGGTCVPGSGGSGSGADCPIGIRIPRDFTGSGSIELGRPAQSGEAYVATTSAFGPGEALHCSGLLNGEVSQALPTIQTMGITAYWGTDPFPLTLDAGPGRDTQTPPTGTEYIVGANAVAAGSVWFQTSATPLSAAEVQREQQSHDQGCSG